MLHRFDLHIWDLYYSPPEGVSNLYAISAHLWVGCFRTNGRWEYDMQRSTFDPQDTWNARSETLRVAEQERADETDRWPTLGELFLETGVVLTVALGAGVVIELLMRGA